MATGLEAVGAASAIIQLISFAGTLISLSFKVYDGIEDELQEYATKVSDAASRVENRAKQVPQMTPEEKKLSQVAQECVAAAEGLKKEAQSITNGYKKGKVLKALYAAVRASQHKKNIQGLDQSLRRCKQIMETELLLKICDKGIAVEQQQSQYFLNLERDVQKFINQIATGNMKIEGLFIRESKATREMINTSLVSEFKALDVRTVSQDQRQRLLRSLKSEEIRQRYNAVMSPSKACFERVFASYERICLQDPKHKASPETYEIDQSWETFTSWVRSNDNIFWFQGKPGSGKSTLMKFIIENNNTTSLLGSSNHNITVLSHFFWKIGCESQNSIKGLLCSLLYDILSSDNGAIDQVLQQFDFSQTKDYYKEWSTEEAENVLFYLLRNSNHLRCIFIDGLDEISHKDGFRALLDIVGKLRSCLKVKVCVSSRPETQLVLGLEEMEAPSLRLEDLTRPEMAVYIQDELNRSSGQIHAELLELFSAILLSKAQGVFLWLVLATESLINGIKNGDDETILFDRLERLPEELEALYENMWLRLGGNNRVYRKIAAKYFNCIIYGGWDYNVALAGKSLSWAANNVPTLAHLSLVMEPGSQVFLSSRPQLEGLKRLSALCNKTEDDIRTRCAGMLRIGRASIHHREGFENQDVLSEISPLTRRVDFIHRTAHDFLVDTESGQAILNYATGDNASLELHTELIKAWLCLVGFYSRCNIGFVQFFDIVARKCMILEDKGASKKTVLRMLLDIQDLCNAGALTTKRNTFYSVPSLPLYFAYNFESFEDTFLSHYARPNTPDLLTSILRNIAEQGKPMLNRGPPVKLIQKMMALGGNPHAMGIPLQLHKASENGSCVAKEITAFELFIQAVLLRFSLWLGQMQGRKELLDIIVSMAHKCQDWHQKTVLIYNCNRNYFHYTNDQRLSWDELLYFELAPDAEWVVLEVDVRFLLLQLMPALKDCELPNHVKRLRDIVQSFTGAHVRIRHIGIPKRGGEEAFCYRVLAQEPFQDLINKVYEPWAVTRIAVSETISLMDRVSDSDFIGGASDSRLKSFEGSFVKVPYTEELDFLAEEVRGLRRIRSVEWNKE